MGTSSTQMSTPRSFTLLTTLPICQSVSAFSPICNPTNCPWGRKAFTGYLGTDESTWKVRLTAGLETHIVNYCFSSPCSINHLPLSLFRFSCAQAWDPAELLKKANLDQLPPILISQGSSDQFLKEQLKPESLPKHPKIKLNMCDGYDHRSVSGDEQKEMLV